MDQQAKKTPTTHKPNKKKKKQQRNKQNEQKGRKMLKFSDASFRADMELWLTGLPCTTSHYFAPWSCPDGIESLDLQFILCPLLQIFNCVLSFQPVINNLRQGGRLQIHTPELYPVPHWLGIAIILCVGERLANNKEKRNIPIENTLPGLSKLYTKAVWTPILP